MSETIVVRVDGQSTAWASNQGRHGVFAGPLRNTARDHAFAGTVVELSPGDFQAAGLTTATGALAAIVASTGPSSEWQLIAAPGHVLARFLDVQEA